MNPFRWDRVSNEWSDELVDELFVRPEASGVYESIRERGHRVILGATTCGKTMILRSLGFPLLYRKESIFPADIGIYIPLDEGLLGRFKEAHRESGKWELFAHYFNLYVMEKIGDLSQQYLLRHLPEDRVISNLKKIYGIRKDISTFEEFNNELLDMQMDVCTFVNERITLGKEEFQGYVTDAPLALRLVCKELKKHLREAIGKDICFYFLLDRYELLSELAAVVNIFLERENCEYFCMKIGTTRVVDLIDKGVKGIIPRCTKDYQIVPLEYTYEDYRSFCEKVANKRLKWARKKLKKPGLTADINILLSNKPTEVEVQDTGYIDQNLSDIVEQSGANIDKDKVSDYAVELKLRRFAEKEAQSGDKQRSKRKNLYYGFDTCAKLSYPIIANFLRLCSEAFEKAQKDKASRIWEGGIISSTIQGQAAITVSRDTYDEIANSAGQYGDRLFNLIYWFGEQINHDLQQNPLSMLKTFKCLGMKIEDIQNLAQDAELCEIIKRGLQESILFVENRRSVEVSGSLPGMISINPIYAPKFGISYDAKHFTLVKTQMFKKWIYTNSPARPPRVFKKPRKLEDQTGFLPVQRGFLVAPFGKRDEEEENRKKRDKIKKAFRDELLKRFSHVRDKDQVEQLFFDAEDAGVLPLSDRIVEKSLRAIKDVSFCVIEISIPSPNVSMEAGMIMALPKQYFLVWNQDDRPFSPNDVLIYLQGIEVPHTYVLSRWHERRKLAHSLVKDYFKHSLLTCPCSKEQPRCEQLPINEESSYVFLNQGYPIFKTEQEVDRALEGFRRLLNDVDLKPIPQREFSKPYSLCSICYSVRRCKYCVIDVTGSYPESTFLYGFAYVLKKDKTLIVHKKGHALPTMLRGCRDYEFDPSNRGQDIFDFFQNTIYP